VTTSADSRPRVASRSNGWQSVSVLATIVALLAMGCLAGLWRVVAALPLELPLDPNEGWNAYHAVAAMAAHGLYPDANSFMTNNYPPLSFYLVGFLGTAFGDNIVAGRVVSAASFIAIAGMIAALVRRFGCSTLEAALASLFFASFLLLHSDYVGMDDPQLLGHAVQIFGLVLLLSSRRSHATEVACASLFVAALFIKHNLIALPLATLIWLTLCDRRSAGRLALFMIVFGLAGLTVFRFAFGFDLLSRLASPRSYSFSLFADNFRDWLIAAALPLTVTLAAGTTRDRFAGLVAIYALAAVIIGGAFLGGAGVDTNAMFDADIACALGAGIAVSRIGNRTKASGRVAVGALAIAVTLPLAFGLARSYDPGWLSTDYWLHPMRDEAMLASADIDYLRSHKGPVLCEMLSLCYWAEKPATVDIFNLDQQFLSGVRDYRPFVKLVNAHTFAVVQLNSPSPFPLPAPVRAAVFHNYRIDRTNDDGVFLVPEKRKGDDRVSGIIGYPLHL